MASPKKASNCPIVEELAVIEKMNQNFDKSLAKDAASCVKKLELATKKMKKLSETKSKALIKKKEIIAKNKVKSNAALKKQLEKTILSITKINDDIILIKEEIVELKAVNLKCTKLIKRRQAEANLITKFRKDEEKKEEQKLKNKLKPKAKSKTKPAAKKSLTTTPKSEATKTEEKNS